VPDGARIHRQVEAHGDGHPPRNDAIDCLRDAARLLDKLEAAGERIPHDIFADLPPKWWPRRPKTKPDRFDATERDKVLAYFRENRPVYYPFALTAFRHQGASGRAGWVAVG
jgi:hypothetical protein